MLYHSSASIFDLVFFILGGNEDIHTSHKSFDELEFWPSRPRCVATLERLEKSSYIYYTDQYCVLIFEWTFFIIAGEAEMHKKIGLV